MNLPQEGMKPPSLSTLVVAATLAAASTLAQGEGCIGCKEAAPTTDRDRIKAARDKFELEMKRETKRPWDGSDLYRKTPSATAPVKDAE
jgi:hypothetical protein